MMLANERWCRVGVFRMHPGPTAFSLVSEGKFPVVRMIRIVRTD
jgi:hypothetical protein